MYTYLNHPSSKSLTEHPSISPQLLSPFHDFQLHICFFFNRTPPLYLSLCSVPFLIGLPPVWPGLCLCCWSQFEGPGPFPSNQPAVCPYLLTAPTGSQSEKIRSDTQRKEIRLRAWWSKHNSSNGPLLASMFQGHEGINSHQTIIMPTNYQLYCSLLVLIDAFFLNLLHSLHAV